MITRALAILLLVTMGPGLLVDQAWSGQSGDGEAVVGHPIRAHEVKVLEKAGLSDPIEQIVESLQAHPELVADFAVGGGAMGFYFPEHIHVLNRKWVYAYFEDGHTSGYGVFEYTVEPDTTLSWKVLLAKPVQALDK